MKPCNDAKVETFDYSHLSPAFTKISKPAKRTILAITVIAWESLDSDSDLLGRLLISFYL